MGDSNQRVIDHTKYSLEIAPYSVKSDSTDKCFEECKKIIYDKINQGPSDIDTMTQDECITFANLPNGSPEKLNLIHYYMMGSASTTSWICFGILE